MNEAFDPLNLLLLGIAVVVFLRLRSVLGRRTGHERPPVDPFARNERERTQPATVSQDGKVVSLPERDVRAPGSAANANVEDDRPPIWKGYATEGSSVAAGIEAIAAADPSFAPKSFLEGAKAAYEMVVTAFAEGDRQTLNNLLSAEVFEGFSAALDEREQEGQVNETTFVGIDDATIIDARLDRRQANVTIRFTSELITSTKDREGNIVDGDPKKVREVKDIWTFARDTSSRDPNWKLVGTEAPN
ncbi:putative lipid-binding transport protein (Tim44 family) [Rhodoligotrophos appendicifer]|uniref:Tim44/TimA family putative adaptor protein n=1 Tax=Rhodoligotrophos appendicifer TaxID=987056 RepID=UPI00118164BC|nr:Tim44/TimA family putative adaptor protein [Rhodoligotrophos appendicifer]